MADTTRLNQKAFNNEEDYDYTKLLKTPWDLSMRGLDYADSLKRGLILGGGSLYQGKPLMTSEEVIQSLTGNAPDSGEVLKRLGISEDPGFGSSLGTDLAVGLLPPTNPATIAKTVGKGIAKVAPKLSNLAAKAAASKLMKVANLPYNFASDPAATISKNTREWYSNAIPELKETAQSFGEDPAAVVQKAIDANVSTDPAKAAKYFEGQKQQSSAVVDKMYADAQAMHDKAYAPGGSNIGVDLKNFESSKGVDDILDTLGVSDINERALIKNELEKTIDVKRKLPSGDNVKNAFDAKEEEILKNKNALFSMMGINTFTDSTKEAMVHLPIDALDSYPAIARMAETNPIKYQNLIERLDEVKRLDSELADIAKYRSQPVTPDMIRSIRGDIYERYTKKGKNLDQMGDLPASKKEAAMYGSSELLANELSKNLEAAGIVKPGEFRAANKELAKNITLSKKLDKRAANSNVADLDLPAASRSLGRGFSAAEGMPTSSGGLSKMDANMLLSLTAAPINFISNNLGSASKYVNRALGKELNIKGYKSKPVADTINAITRSGARAAEKTIMSPYKDEYADRYWSSGAPMTYELQQPGGYDENTDENGLQKPTENSDPLGGF